MLLIITSTGDMLFGFININIKTLNDLEPLKKEVVSEFFAIFGCSAFSALNCDEIAGNRPKQTAYKISSI